MSRLLACLLVAGCSPDPPTSAVPAVARHTLLVVNRSGRPVIVLSPGPVTEGRAMPGETCITLSGIVEGKANLAFRHEGGPTFRAQEIQLVRGRGLMITLAPSGRLRYDMASLQLAPLCARGGPIGNASRLGVPLHPGSRGFEPG